MIDVKELLRRWQAGHSARQMHREGVADRKTATRYTEAAKAAGLSAETELSDEIVAEVARRVQERPEVEPSEPWKVLDAHRDQIEAWLRQPKPLRLVRVRELLERNGVETAYTTLRRWAHHELGWRERPVTVRIDDPPPGEEAQIDFGEMGFVLDAEGRRRKLWVLIVTLTMSRYMFVWPTFAQTLVAVCEGLDAAWRFFGGVVQRIVPDNMSAIVERADPQEPKLVRAFAEYAQARGFFVDPARVRRPRDKARVENQVPYVRERWFAGETFSDDERELRRSAEHWCREVAGSRVHGTTRNVPREVFETEELPHLSAVPEAPFDVPTWTRPKVHPDHHVHVARALYSVPTRFVGKYLEARADRTSVRLYDGAELVKMHPRVAPGKRATDPSDYPVGKAGYATRSIEGIRSKAREKGEHIGAFTEQLLSGPLPWSKMRQAYGLLRLCDRHGVARVEAMCARALAFEVVDVPRIERMLKAAQQVEDTAAETGKVVRLPASRFARDAASFATMKKDAASTKGGA
jgi:transposase